MEEKNGKDIRGEKVEVRLTRREKRLLKKRSGEDMSKYIRDIIFKEQLPTDPALIKSQKELRESVSNLKKEINRIGVNINQIVKNNNSSFYSNAEKRNLFMLMGEIDQKMQEIEEKIYQNKM